ncbi:MAG: GldG family protein [Ruminococcus sp.]|nr:GldG family protein [Ruminococcus sp.]
MEKDEKSIHRKKKLKYGGIATAITLIVTAVVILVNVVVSLLMERFPNFRLDLTQSNVYQVSDETLDYIKNLSKDVEIAVSSEESNFEKDSLLKTVSEMLKKYEGYSDKISVTYFDTAKNPDILSKYQALYTGTISADNIIIRSGDRVKVYSLLDMFELDNQKFQQYYYYGNVTLQECITGFKGEQILTTAVMNVTDSNVKTVGIIANSNGSMICSQSTANQYTITNMKQLLTDNGYDVTDLDMVTSEITSETCDILILPAPLNDLTTDSVQKLENFLYNDGKLGKELIYIADCRQGNTPNLNAFLQNWNISVNNSYIVDENTSTRQAVNLTIGSYYVPIVTPSAEGYSGGISNSSLPIIAPLSREISTLSVNNGRVVTNLLETSSTSFAYPLDLDKMSSSNNANSDNSINEENNINSGNFTDNNNADSEEPTDAVSDESSPATTTFDVESAEKKSYPVMVLSENEENVNGERIKSDVLVIGSLSFLDYYVAQDPAYNNADYFISALNTICGKDDNVVIASKDMTVKTLDMTQSNLITISVVVVIIIPVIMIICGVIIGIRRRKH